MCFHLFLATAMQQPSLGAIYARHKIPTVADVGEGTLALNSPPDRQIGLYKNTRPSSNLNMPKEGPPKSGVLKSSR